MTYDVLLQKNSVYIGMEDVCVTYELAELTKDVSAGKAQEIISLAAKDFTTSEQYQNTKGTKSYYPVEWDLPCRAIVAPSGALSSFVLNDYNDLYRAQKKGAVEIRFTEDEKIVAEKIKALAA